jgi:protein-S-isoprenylcysteine O-methyltransferase Ste14
VEAQPKDTTCRSLLLLAESFAFTVLVPGTVTVWLPWILLDGAVTVPGRWAALQYAALPLIGAGVVVYGRCLRDFVVRGRGIPAPIDHPRRLVVRGLYRYVRNPMYLGVLCVLVGEAVFLASPVLAFYATAWLGIVHGVVMLYEEPALRRRFGAEYDRYTCSVRRWLPGRPSVDR